MYDYEKEREEMNRRIEAQERRIYGLLTNIVVSIVTAVIITTMLAK